MAGLRYWTLSTILYCTGCTSALSPLSVGQPVLVQDAHARKTEWRRELCQGQLSNRSYVVDVDGQPLHRNRQFIKPTDHWWS